MKTNEMIAGLRNCATTQFTGCKECPAYCRSANCLNRLHTAAADTLEAQQKRIEELEAELKDERHRHDRYVDFELAQAKELEQMRAERRWIPVTERLPEDDLPKNTKKKMIRCLVYTDKGTIKPCVRQRWEHFDGQLVPWQWNKDLYTKPTHWMYYPQPPKGE